MKISIAQSFKLFGIIIIAGLAITTAASYFSLYKLKIGSTAYENIIASKDLVSDILPPPAYIIEAYLEVNLARDQADKLDFHISKLASLQADYIERRDHWAQATGLPDDLRDELTKTSDEQVQKFWKETTTQFIPALKSKNTAAAEASMALLGTIYEKHRAIINGVVVKANAFSAAAEQAAGAQAFIFQILMFGTAALVILLTIVSLRLMRIKASDPLAVLADYMGELADEKYETEVPLRGNTDEIGHMARSVDVFRAAILERRRNRLEQSETDLRNQRERRSADEAVQFERETALAAIAAGLTAISNKNLTYRVETQMPPAFSKLQTDFNSAISALEVAMDDVVLGISAIGAGTNQISSAAEGLSVQTEHQAATLEETAAALAQVSKMVNATAEGAIKTSTIVKNTKTDAEASNKIVQNVVQAMEKIKKSSNSISNILGVIDEIAFQTNLLALNAGVEAARAGDAGRGFAVVATEVRVLAQRSAQAAKEIKVLIEDSSNQVNQGVVLVGQTVEALERMVAQVVEIDRAVGIIAGNSQGQAASLMEINVAVGEMDVNTQKNAAVVEETTAATKALKNETNDLIETIQAFRTTNKSQMRRAA